MQHLLVGRRAFSRNPVTCLLCIKLPAQTEYGQPSPPKPTHCDRGPKPVRLSLSASQFDWNDAAGRARAGSKSARDEIMLKAWPVAKSMARKYARSSDAVEDLTSEGLLGTVSERTGKPGSGVLYAIDNWDESKGRDFLPFMKTAIGWAMNASLKRGNKETHQSLSTPLSEDDEAVTLGDALANDTAADDFDRVAARVDLGAWLDRLDDRERHIIEQHYGLNGEAPKTLREIGRDMGISGERVRKIELAAKEKLGIKGIFQ